MTRTFCAAVSLASASLVGPWAAAADDPLTEYVVKLVEARLEGTDIGAKIDGPLTDFDTSVDAHMGLSNARAADDVVAAVVKAGQASSRPTAPIPVHSSSAPVVPTPVGRDENVRMAIPGSRFREALSSGGEGPEMVVVPEGRFLMGCLSYDDDCWDWEKPVREVTIAQSFALSVLEVTFEDFDRFTYPNKVDDRGWRRGRRPVINVSWNDAQDYVEWLSLQTGAEYRLPSEAEWEYAARAGTSTKYGWGNEVGANQANCDGCGSQWDNEQTAPAGSFRSNGFGLHDMHGNVWEWVTDCWNGTYFGAPLDGTPWLQGGCGDRVLRGGSWNSNPRNLRTAFRLRKSTGDRYINIGFRVVRTLAP